MPTLHRSPKPPVRHAPCGLVLPCAGGGFGWVYSRGWGLPGSRKEPLVRCGAIINRGEKGGVGGEAEREGLGYFAILPFARAYVFRCTSLLAFHWIVKGQQEIPWVVAARRLTRRLTPLYRQLSSGVQDSRLKAATRRYRTETFFKNHTKRVIHQLIRHPPHCNSIARAHRGRALVRSLVSFSPSVASAHAV